jgi:tRNA modification GTPase
MLASNSDTICAIATPPGKGGVAIIRISGREALSIAERISHKTNLTPRLAHYVTLFGPEGESIDSALLIYFKGPHSFTGEDVVELQTHGSPVILNIVLRVLTLYGARPAQPGEYSKRAYLNDKIDLVQAEAIADLINASTESAALSAQRSLNGSFSIQVNSFVENLINLRVFVEAAIDFPEEEIDFIAEHNVINKLEGLITHLSAIIQNARQGQLIQEGTTFALVGAPNAGKSSLLNCLAGIDRAIVTDIAGTTRDTLDTTVDIDGLPVTFIDTAGLRETDDYVEKVGIERTLSAIKQADYVLFIVDGSVHSGRARLEELVPPYVADTLKQKPILGVINKSDKISGDTLILEGIESAIVISAKLGLNIDSLRNRICELVGLTTTSDLTFSARERHLTQLNIALNLLQTGFEQLHYSGASELLAEDLKQAQTAMNQITGTFTSDDLLGEIFSSFCIGK